VARDQVAILGRDQIRLDVVGAQLDAERIGLQRVLGQVAAAAAPVADDQRLRFVVGEVMRAPVMGLAPRSAEQQRGERHAGGSAAQQGCELHGVS